MPSVLLRWSNAVMCRDMRFIVLWTAKFRENCIGCADTRHISRYLSAREETEFFFIRVKALFQDGTGEGSGTVEESNIVNAQFFV